MTVQSSGFQVVRKPDQNFNPAWGGGFLPDPPKLGNMHYCGFDRLAWYDVSEAFFANEIPDRIRLLRSELAYVVEFEIDIKVLRDIGKTHELLQFSNRLTAANEISSLYIEGAPYFELPSTLKLEFLGIDIFVSGYGSMIREGIFARPDLFPEVFPHMNRNGLFDDIRGPIDEYIKRFEEFDVGDGVEIFPITEKRQKISVHRIFV